MSYSEGRSYTPEERAVWERDNAIPPPVLRLDVLRYQRRAREMAAERESRIAQRRATKT